jgi:hypothetical protein
MEIYITDVIYAWTNNISFLIKKHHFVKLMQRINTIY